MATKIDAERFAWMLAQYLPRIGHAELAPRIAISETDETEFCVSLDGAGLGVDVGWPVKVRGLDGERDVSGFRVFAIKVHPASRTHPEEAEDVTRAELRRDCEALAEVGRCLAEWAADNLPQLPAHLAYPTIAEEW